MKEFEDRENENVDDNDASNAKKEKKAINGFKTKMKMEGIRIRCVGSGGKQEETEREMRTKQSSTEAESDPKEEDDLIWWIWEEKLVGFSDW